MWPFEYAMKLLVEDVKEHAVQRPVTLLITASIATFTFMMTYNIYSIDALVDFIYASILHVWTDVVHVVAQFFVDLVASIFMFIAMFVVGVVEGMMDMWKGFKLPPIHVPKINIHF